MKISRHIPIQKHILVALAFVVSMILAVTFFAKYENNKTTPLDVYASALTADKISKSAPITIYLPKDADPLVAKANITFSPAIKGTWRESNNKNQLVYKPKNDLAVGKYYAVLLTETDTKKTRHEFLVEENPSVLAVFPKEKSETHENSDITILFSRPMVALTTLDELDTKSIPVEISPKTEGKFKWISTRNLQFIPKERLQRSSNYTIRVKAGFTSIEGLEIPTSEYHFTVRPLRYTDRAENEKMFNQPYAIQFNQEVDLEKTMKEISLFRVDGEKKESIPFQAEYGKESKSENKTIIAIFNAKDRHGREKLWDFQQNYQIVIQKVYPSEGDIVIDKEKTFAFHVRDIINNTYATSERSTNVTPDFFDPAGKFWISFSENIDIEKTNIAGAFITGKGYGEKCRELEIGEEQSSEEKCEKVQDTRQVYVTFDHGAISNNQKLSVTVNDIYNLESLKLNLEPITFPLTTFPTFEIRNTSPGNNETNAHLIDMTICSSSPIAQPDKGKEGDFFKTNLDHTIYVWNKSYRAGKYDAPCNTGEFRTYIRYGLRPQDDYTITLALKDEFGQQAEKIIRFRTEKMDSNFLRFYSLQKTENVTTPKNTELAFGVENMTYADLNICKLDALAILKYIDSNPSSFDAPVSLNCQEVKTDRLTLPDRYWIKNYFTIDLKKYFADTMGHYIVTLSHPDYEEYFRTYLTVTNLSILEKKIELQQEDPILGSQNLYWITNLETLDSVQGATIDLYQRNFSQEKSNLVLATSVTTDEKGIAQAQSESNLSAAIVKKGNDSTLLTYDTTLQYGGTAYSAKRTYLYSDRPIYRPGDTVHVKGLYRLGYDGDYEIFRDKKIPVTVQSSRDENIFSEELAINEYGTFNADIVLDTAAPLGQYRICTDYECSNFDVEEYVPSPFEVKLSLSKDEFIASETMDMDIDANYYFGVPVEGGTVSYSIMSQDYYFDKYTDEYFSFGSPWYRCWYECPYGDKFVLSNETELSGQGTAKIQEKLDFKKIFPKESNSKIFVVNVTVTNDNGQSVSGQKSFIVHAGKWYLGMQTDKTFLGKDESFQLRVKSVNTEGKPISVSKINLVINSIKWVSYERKEVDGSFYHRSEEKREKVIEKKIQTDGNGNAKDSLALSEEGEYEIELTAMDDMANIVKSTYSLYVYGKGSGSVMPTNDESLEIKTDNGNLKVGDTAKVIIKSPFEKAKALISIERGKVFSYEVVDVVGNFYEYRFPITEAYVPNIYFSAFLLSDKPEVKFGQIPFAINRDIHELTLDIQSDKTSYLPGESVTLNLQVKDHDDKPVQAELSLAVADLSVLALKGNPKKNPLVFFYDGFPLTVTTSSNLKNALKKLDVPKNTKGGSGGGSGEGLAVKKRGTFKDTALWVAEIRTDEKGHAETTFTLPDNLTTWQVESVGITTDTKVGAGYREFLARKELMTVPLKPRFTVPGDRFFIGAKVFNQTDADQKLEVSYASDTLMLTGKNVVQKITIPKEDNTTVYFEVEAKPDMLRGMHSFILSAKNEKYEDTVQNTILITPNETYEATATSNNTTDAEAREYLYLPENVVKDRGSLTIKSSATLAVFLSDALQDLIDYPYGCSEQIASQLSAIAIVTNALQLKNVGTHFQLDAVEHEGKKYSAKELVDIGLASLYNHQNSDGGFAYYTDNSNFYLTLHVATALRALKSAGFNINDDAFKKSVEYIRREIKEKALKGLLDNNMVILTAYTLNAIDGTQAIDSALKSTILEILKDDAFLNEQINNTSLTYLAMLLSNTKDASNDQKNRVYDILENRLTIDSRGAFLPINSNYLWEYYETPIKNTALALQAFVRGERKTKVNDLVLRWLLNSRDKKGAWGSTNNSVTVLGALTDYLAWTRETQSEFDLNITLDNVNLAKYNFNADTIFDQKEEVIPVQNLALGKNTVVEFAKTPKNNGENPFYYDMSLKYFLPIDEITSRDEGFTITREWYALEDKNGKNPLKEAVLGDVLRGHLKVYIPKHRNFVAIEDFIPAGMEIVNFNLETSDKSLLDYRQQENYGGVRKLYPSFEESHDDRIFLFMESVSEGVYEFDYFVRALVPGQFQHLPAVASEMYFPEHFGRTEGGYFTVKEE